MNGAVDDSDQLVAISGLEILIELELLGGLVAFEDHEDGFFVVEEFGAEDLDLVTLTVALGLFFSGVFLGSFIGVIDGELAGTILLAADILPTLNGEGGGI